MCSLCFDFQFSAKDAKENSPQFQLRVFAQKITSPGGAKDNLQPRISAAPPGLAQFSQQNPAVETAGYYRSPLCGFYSAWNAITLIGGR